MPGILIAVINYVQGVACKARETMPRSDLVSSIWFDRIPQFLHFSDEIVNDFFFFFFLKESLRPISMCINIFYTYKYVFRFAIVERTCVVTVPMELQNISHKARNSTETRAIRVI